MRPRGPIGNPALFKGNPTMQTILIFAVIAIAAPGLKEKGKPDTNIVGTWEHVNLWYGGKPKKTAVTRHVFDADGQWRQTDEAGTVIASVTPRVALNPEKTPVHFDVHYKWVRGAAKKGIMKIEGDKLTICYNAGQLNEDRPDAFTTTVENGWYMFEMRRIKAKKE